LDHIFRVNRPWTDFLVLDSEQTRPYEMDVGVHTGWLWATKFGTVIDLGQGRLPPTGFQQDCCAIVEGLRSNECRFSFEWFQQCYHATFTCV